MVIGMIIAQINQFFDITLIFPSFLVNNLSAMEEDPSEILGKNLSFMNDSPKASKKDQPLVYEINLEAICFKKEIIQLCGRTQEE